jgi:SAM-dependent methyltransferase
MSRAGISELDSPNRIHHLTAVIARKPALHALYEEFYSCFEAALAMSPERGIAVELGSGGGFLKRRLPDVVTSDVLPYEGVDRVVDAMEMQFEDESLRALLLLDVFHHIPDSIRFLREAERCLVPGGRIVIIDPHVSWVSRPILQFLHHEPFQPDAPEWRFDSTGPLSGANGAQAWIVFQRDRSRFERVFPRLKLVEYRPHTPFRYWLSGGLKPWTLLPGWAFRTVTKLETGFLKMFPAAGSFVTIHIVKR